MNNNIKLKLIKKIFPIYNSINIDDLQFDDVGLYSISLPKDADIISNFIINNIQSVNNMHSIDNTQSVNNMHSINNTQSVIIIDGTAGIGGNTISFCNNFKNVIAFEIDENRFKILNNNLKVYNLNNVITYNLNSLDSLPTYNNLNTPIIYFFDPPWGGPNYKKYKNLTFKFNDLELNQIVINIKEFNKNSYISFKLPTNFDLSIFNSFKYKILNLKKMLVILIFPDIE
jgi:16S rRNA G966 N2-methylase RsmD